VRPFAALWRHALAKGKAARIRRRCLGGVSELPPFHTMTDAQVTEYFDRMVAAADAAHAFVTKRCLLSNVVATDYDVEGPRVCGSADSRRAAVWWAPWPISTATGSACFVVWS